METKPITYRVSDEVDAELKRLAKIHGGVDKALRVVFGWSDPAVADDLQPLSLQQKAAAAMLGRSFKVRFRPELRPFSGPIQKPKDQGRK